MLSGWPRITGSRHAGKSPEEWPRMRFALIYPPGSTALSTPPGGLAALQAYLRGNWRGTVEVYDLNIRLLDFLRSRWNEVRPEFEACFRNRLSAALPAHENGLLLGALNMDLALVDLLREKPAFHLRELLSKVLRNLIHARYTSRLLSEGHYLRCGYSHLGWEIDRFAGDEVFREFLHSVLRSSAQVVGFSLLAESQLPFAILIARILKSAASTIKFVAGGPYITEILTQPLEARHFFRDFDYLVAQEGESALANILEAIENRRPPDHPNVFAADGLAPRNLLIEPIETLPPPDFDGLELSRYISPDLSLPVYGSKGCTWGRCRFCSQNALSYREKPVEKLLDDIRSIMAHTGISHFQIVDENIPPPRLQQFAEQVLETGLPIRWFVQVRLDRGLTAKVLRLMRRAGCSAIEFGLESGSAAMLRQVRKGIVLAEVRRILRDCAALDYEVILNCMAGFPGETAEMARETVQFLDSIAAELPHVRLTCNTQTLKLYRTSRYITSGEIAAGAGTLSTSVEWSPPEWLPDFQRSYRNHLLFSGRPQAQPRTQPGAEFAPPAEPAFGLTQGCCLIENVPYDFAANRPASPPADYLVITSRSGGPPDLFQLNEVMSLLAGELDKGRVPLSRLRLRFSERLAGYDANEVAATFRDGMLRLNAIGALAVC